jgi:plasmid stability protein
MKTTVELPDRLYRQLKARAALKGQSIKAFFIDAIRDKLAAEQSPQKKAAGWKAVYGKAKKEDMEELRRIIDEEFARIDPEGWD